MKFHLEEDEEAYPLGRANVHLLLARRLENQVDGNCMQIDRHVFALPSETHRNL